MLHSTKTAIVSISKHMDTRAWFRTHRFAGGIDDTQRSVMRSTWKWVSWEEFKTELQNSQCAPWEIKQSWYLLLADGHDVHTERYGFLWMFKRTKILLLVKTEIGLDYNDVE